MLALVTVLVILNIKYFTKREKIIAPAIYSINETIDPTVIPPTVLKILSNEMLCSNTPEVFSVIRIIIERIIFVKKNIIGFG